MKHLTELKAALEMSFLKQVLLQRDNDQSMHKFPKDIYAQKDFSLKCRQWMYLEFAY